MAIGSLVYGELLAVSGSLTDLKSASSQWRTTDDRRPVDMGGVYKSLSAA